jgi:hypothetical protein
MARKCKRYISKYKLILCEYNAFYLSEIAVIGFTVREIKRGIVFWGTPGTPKRLSCVQQPAAAKRKYCLENSDCISLFYVVYLLRVIFVEKH